MYVFSFAATDHPLYAMWIEKCEVSQDKKLYRMNSVVLEQTTFVQMTSFLPQTKHPLMSSPLTAFEWRPRPAAPSSSSSPLPWLSSSSVGWSCLCLCWTWPVVLSGLRAASRPWLCSARCRWPSTGVSPGRWPPSPPAAASPSSPPGPPPRAAPAAGRPLWPPRPTATQGSDLWKTDLTCYSLLKHMASSHNKDMYEDTGAGVLTKHVYTLETEKGFTMFCLDDTNLCVCVWETQDTLAYLWLPPSPFPPPCFLFPLWRLRYWGRPSAPGGWGTSRASATWRRVGNWRPRWRRGNR